MRKRTIRSINYPSKYVAIRLLAGVICLGPAAAGAGTLAPTDTATGTGALGSENGGGDNTADGYYALFSNTTGRFNTAAGASALFKNTTGNQNTACGFQGLLANTTGSYNAASGSQALVSNTTGSNNTANGALALLKNTTGQKNTANGISALYTNTTGHENTASGAYALSSNITGYYNTAVGSNALVALTSGASNIALGYGAGKLTTSGSSNIYIGHLGYNGSESKVTRIGQAQTQVYIAGIAHTPLSGATVVIKPNGQLGVVASSARYKKDIKPLADTVDKLAQLRPVSFRYKTEPEATHYGLIAEEVDKVMPELVVRDEKSRPESVQYQELIPLLLQQWKAERAEIVSQRALIERQQAELTELRRMLATRLAMMAEESRAGGGGGR